MVGRFTKGATLALLLLAGCGKMVTAEPDGDGGRYRGIGIATPGDQWKKLADAPKPSNAKLARLSDDDYVVFVTDSRTGEVRECGNRTGFCIRFQPWQHPAPLAPLSLTSHARAEEADAPRGEPAVAENETMPAATKAK